MNRVVSLIQWRCQEDLSYAPSLKLLGLAESVPVLIEELIAQEMGKGAIIDYDEDLHAINGVIEKSDNYQTPTCECGYHMRVVDIKDGTLRCRSTDLCISKVLKFYQRLLNYCTEDDTWSDYLQSNRNEILDLINLELEDSDSIEIMKLVNGSLITNDGLALFSSIQSESPVSIGDLRSWLKALSLIKHKLDQ